MAGIFGSGAKRLLTTALLGTREMDRRDLMKQKAAEIERQRMLASQGAGLFTGSPAIPAGGPVANQDGMDISAAFSPQAGRPAQAPVAQDPRAMAAALARLQGQGLDTSNFARLAEMAAPKPMNVNGVILDERDPSNIGREIAELDKGQVRLYDSEGRFAGVRNADGYVQSAAELAGAVKGAEARASAPYEFVNVPTPTGAPAVTSKAAAAGGTFVGQAPTEAMLAKDRAQAGIDLPQNVQTAQQTLDLIQQLRTHPGRKFGVGLAGIVPAIPGTDTKDFVALLDQARGKAFLEAFASLKGGGQITEVEGRKATEAIARLDRTQSPAGFDKALADLESVVKAGLERSQRKAGPAARPAASLRTIPLADRLAEARLRGLIQ
jgi:hypothetical protein